MNRIGIIGGGLAGLVSAIQLARNGYNVTVFEKKTYPFHKVCGEYVSNEVLSFLQREKLLPDNIDLPQINRFQFSTISGKSITIPLDLGGFGISRFLLDNHLAELAKHNGVNLLENTAIQEVEFQNDEFEVTTLLGKKTNYAFLIGAYGKNGVLDKNLNRKFTQYRSPYIGVKYHIKTDFPRDLVALHNFEGGYCGLSAIENNQFNLCYLGLRESVKKAGSIEEMENQILKKNPFLKSVFEDSEFLFKKPEVINAFSFRPKKVVENHILMAGDTAGLITPLCGNGMAMAIHSAKILADTIHQHLQSNNWDRAHLEADYMERWNAIFKTRLWVGRKTQALFGSKWTSRMAFSLLKNSPIIARKIIKNTHGKPF